jgi:hypothetical protein
VARDDLGIALPYQIETGAVGLMDVRVTLPRGYGWRPDAVSEPIFENKVSVRRVLNDTSDAAQKKVVEEFVRRLYDLASVAL